MGDYTYHTLSWKALDNKEFRSCEHDVSPDAKFCPDCGVAISSVDYDSVIPNFIKQKQAENDLFCYGINEYGEGTDSVKWYDHDDDILVISKQFPNVLFTLHGEGEEPGDIWKAYYLNGVAKTAKAEIKIAPPEEFFPQLLKVAKGD